jgi:hypothetical protein
MILEVNGKPLPILVAGRRLVGVTVQHRRPCHPAAAGRREAGWRAGMESNRQVGEVDTLFRMDRASVALQTISTFRRKGVKEMPGDLFERG